MLHINDTLSIPETELAFTTSRSGGPGGQNVNKVESRVTVELDVVNSPSLSDEQRSRIRERLASRINQDGVLKVSSQIHRSQSANRDTAVERLASLLRNALKERKPRKKTRVSRAAKKRRLEEKRKHAEKKRTRGRVER